MSVSTTHDMEPIEAFVDEARESLQDLPEQLETFRQTPSDSESINVVFRAIHSIKGCASFLDLDGIQVFSHKLENTLDNVRNGNIALNEDLEQAFIQGFDRLDVLLAQTATGDIATELSEVEQEILEQVKTFATDCPSKQSPEDELVASLRDLSEMILQHDSADSLEWGSTLQTLIDDFTADDSDVSSHDDQTFTPADFVDQPFVCGGEDVTQLATAVLQFFLTHQGNQNTEEAEKAFLAHTEEFATCVEKAGRDELAVSIRAAENDCRMIVDSPLDLDENLITVIWDQIAPVLNELKAPTKAEQNTTTPDTQEKTSEPKSTPEKTAVKTRFVRVKEERLDEFLEHVSRLFITGELFKDVQARMAETGQINALVEEFRNINHDLKSESAALQQGVMSLRRVSISGLFSKFPRMARTLASNLDKKITVHTSGEDTEIDKTLAEDMDAPMTHLIRNVVDHGIETPDERRVRGVAETGNVWLSAEQTKNHVLITIRDDGRGIDPDKLRQKAVEKGILSQDDANGLSDQEATNLVFHAGFSTAEKVTDVSGRGVGMDVVCSTLAEHDGKVTVQSKLGVGTTFTLTVPVRQATLVIDGLMVEQAGQPFVIPFDNVKELVEIHSNNFNFAHGRRMATMRQQTFDAITLGEILELNDATTTDNRPVPTILVSSNEGSCCILVDKVIGHRQVVVSNLKEIIANADKMAGVAQLGGGRLALVLNIPEVIKGLTQL